MKALSGLNLEELEKVILSLDEKKFRAKQVLRWIYTKSASNFEQMTDVAKDLRAKLSSVAVISDTKIKTRQISTDGTIKYLLEYQDGACTETVLMRFDNRSNLTACVSSQVGCAMGCDFCATGKCGLKRQLTHGEIIEQILTIQRDTGLKVTNVVFMGQGEPLANFENVYKAIELINNYLQIGIRRITVSSCGIVPLIYEMCERKLVPTLAISLHSACSAQRAEIMPVERKYNLDKLREALNFYTSKTGDRVTIEYVLLGGYNDTKECALKLCEYISEIKCNVNLIPYNQVSGTKYQKPKQKDVMTFKYLLETSGKKVTVRLERGADIDAACGQLAGKE
ncbi:23S rRNA (adenine2503-C2)-methyltransferase [Candidatus Gastranaerophilus sp. (ex Termes propinquus)]|nr:23S rRNA (adenine2503-C2)-methyltransferase [Candidatus Gastranaerophilus sp. (ex Termes propinquus)]